MTPSKFIKHKTLRVFQREKRRKVINYDRVEYHVQVFPVEAKREQY